MNKLLRRRMLFAKKKGGGLPAGYTECEYLEASGHQYIVTNYYPKFADELRLTAFLTNKGELYQSLLSARINSDNTRYGFMVSRGNREFVAWGSNGSTTIYLGYENRTFNITMRANACEINGNKYELQSINVDSPVAMALFCTNENGSFFNFASQSLGALYINGELRVIPCLDSNGRPCMYDPISQTPFYNSGSGEFGYKIKNGEYVTPV